MSLPQQDQPHKDANYVGSAVSDSDGDAGMFPSQTTTASPSVLDPGYREKAVLLGLFEKQDSFPLPDGYREVGVVFEGLTVHGAARGNRQVESFEIAILKVGQPDTVLNSACTDTSATESQMVDVYSFAKRIFNWHTGPTRPIISDFYGVVPEGETMLVLGRPGAGCSTLLRTLANVREPFVKVDGNVFYANISAADAKK
jgi:ATP-binding cassette subfamily G (WHITE) protein 2 (SNQ2)